MGYSAEDIKRLRPSHGLQSVATAVEDMLLAIHALGYGSCWMTGPTVAQDEFKILLGHGEDRFIAALMPVDEPEGNPPSRAENRWRKSLGNRVVFHSGRPINLHHITRSAIQHNFIYPTPQPGYRSRFSQLCRDILLFYDNIITISTGLTLQSSSKVINRNGG